MFGQGSTNGLSASMQSAQSPMGQMPVMSQTQSMSLSQQQQQHMNVMSPSSPAVSQALSHLSPPPGVQHPSQMQMSAPGYPQQGYANYHHQQRPNYYPQGPHMGAHPPTHQQDIVGSPPQRQQQQSMQSIRGPASMQQQGQQNQQGQAPPQYVRLAQPLAYVQTTGGQQPVLLQGQQIVVQSPGQQQYGQRPMQLVTSAGGFQAGQQQQIIIRPQQSPGQAQQQSQNMMQQQSQRFQVPVQYTQAGYMPQGQRPPTASAGQPQGAPPYVAIRAALANPHPSSSGQQQHTSISHTGATVTQHAPAMAQPTALATPAGGSAQHHMNTDHGRVLLEKRRLEDLAAEVDPCEQLDEDVKDALLTIADEFVDKIVSDSARIAKHRKSNSLEVKDVQLVLERNWNIWVPGFSSSDKRPYKKAAVTDAHKQRMALIKKALKKV